MLSELPGVGGGLHYDYNTIFKKSALKHLRKSTKENKDKGTNGRTGILRLL